MLGWLFFLLIRATSTERLLFLELELMKFELMLKLDRLTMKQSVSRPQIVNISLRIWAVEMQMSVIFLLLFLFFVLFYHVGEPWAGRGRTTLNVRASKLGIFAVRSSNQISNNT